MTTRSIRSASLASLAALFGALLVVAVAYTYSASRPVTSSARAIDERRGGAVIEEATAPLGGVQADGSAPTGSNADEVEAPFNAPPVQKRLPAGGRPMSDGDQSGGPRGGHKGGFDY